MKIFIDSADIEEIKEVKSWGILDGVTTNPSLIKKASKKYSIKNLETYIKKMLKISGGIPVSLEVAGTTYEEMVKEGKTLFKKFNKIAGNVYIKIPVNPCVEKECSRNSDGIRAIKKLKSLGISINSTLIFTPEQALLAAKAKADFVSPFVGREDDYLREIARIKFKKEDYFPKEGFRKGKKIIEDEGIVSGVDLIKKIKDIFNKNKIKSEVLAASIRNKRQVAEVAIAGADIATIPYNVLKSLLNHPKTLEGMKKFKKDVVKEYERVLKDG